MGSIWKKSMRVAISVLILATVCTTAVYAAEVKVGTVSAGTLNMRGGASTSAPVVGQAANGEKVVVLSQSGDWCEVVFRQTKGYMHADYLKLSSSGSFSIGSGVINDSPVNFRKSPSLSAGIITTLGKNKAVTVVGVEDGWYKVEVDGKTGYVFPDYVTITKAAEAPKADATAKPTAAEAPKADSGNSKDALRADIVAYAKSFLGCKYKYGTSNGKTFDCSGFTSWVYSKFGYSLNRSAAGQVSNGTKVSKDSLKPGDLVLFRDPKVNTAAASHVGMYVGDGKFIHCSSGGGCVKYNYLSDSYYSRYFIGGRRIVQ